MHAVTLSAGWAYAVAHCGKDVENRSWATSHRGALAIHAGLEWGDGVTRALARQGFAVPVEADYGAVVAVADLVDVANRARSRWAMRGFRHWVLSDIRPLIEPVHVTGRLGVWPLPGDVAGQVRRQLAIMEGAGVS